MLFQSAHAWQWYSVTDEVAAVNGTVLKGAVKRRKIGAEWQYRALDEEMKEAE